MPFAEQVFDLLDGRIILTADHGECLGENNWYGHGANLLEESLVEVLSWVPWYEEGKYKQMGEVTINSEEIDNESLQQRMKNLGYL